MSTKANRHRRHYRRVFFDIEELHGRTVGKLEVCFCCLNDGVHHVGYLHSPGRVPERFELRKPLRDLAAGLAREQCERLAQGFTPLKLNRCVWSLNYISTVEGRGLNHRTTLGG